MKKSVPKTAIKSLVIIFISSIIGMLALIATFAIPVNSINQNARESAFYFQDEGAYPRPFFWSNRILDNYTDALMLSSAAYEGDESIIDKSLSVYRYNLNESKSTPYESFVEYYTNQSNGNFNKLSYPRYWHGYLCILKPLLFAFNYKSIRMINSALQLLLTLLLCCILWKKNKRFIIIPWLITWAALPPPIIGLSLQYSDVFYIYTISSMILMLKNDVWYDSEKYYYFFLLIGIATSYIDLLTYPIATLGMPLALYLVLNNNEDIKKKIKNIFVFTIMWGLGYVGMWTCKWIFASIFTDSNVIWDGIESVIYRTSMVNGKGESFSLIKMIYHNIRLYATNPIIPVAVVLWFYMLVISIKRHLFKTGNAAVLIIVSLIPIVWYVFASNHSAIHFFACESLTVSGFALLCAVTPVPCSAHSCSS